MQMRTEIHEQSPGVHHSTEGVHVPFDSVLQRISSSGHDLFVNIKEINYVRVETTGNNLVLLFISTLIYEIAKNLLRSSWILIMDRTQREDLYLSPAYVPLCALSASL